MGPHAQKSSVARPHLGGQRGVDDGGAQLRIGCPLIEAAVERQSAGRRGPPDPGGHREEQRIVGGRCRARPGVGATATSKSICESDGVEAVQAQVLHKGDVPWGRRRWCRSRVEPGAGVALRCTPRDDDDDRRLG